VGGNQITLNGDIVDSTGTVLGRHDGITNFTVGQRKGLNLSGNAEPLFVLPSLRIAHASIVGEQHVRCTMTGPEGGRISGIAFRAVQSALGAALLNSKGRPVHVAASLKAEEWRGEVRVQALIRDVSFAA